MNSLLILIGPPLFIGPPVSKVYNLRIGQAQPVSKADTRDRSKWHLYYLKRPVVQNPC